jgi:hypothetical protein
VQTLADLLAARRLINENADEAIAVTSRRGKVRILIPGENPVLLPSDVTELSTLLQGNIIVSDLDPHFRAAARISLLYEPTFVIPLKAPSAQELTDLGRDPVNFRNERPRCLCLGVQVQVPDMKILYGVARVIALENGIRMGKTAILSVDDFWSIDLDEVIERISDFLQEAKEDVRAEPEEGAKKWRTVVALLGGTNDPSKLRQGWMREFRLLAGLYSIRLDIRPKPETARAEIVAELRSKPPTGLLVWADWVAHPEVFIRAYLSARPGAYAELLGRADRASDYDDHVAELRMHLAEIAPPLADSVDLPGDVQVTWEVARTEILALAGPHLVLTERAVAMLENNPYPKPSRMLQHMQRLADLAKSYRTASGRLGKRLEDVAIGDYGIEIALFDQELNEKTIEIDGRSLNTQPHVKVDDYKSPTDVGRIYFALDIEERRFVVDHIGLHDYRLFFITSDFGCCPVLQTGP